MTPLTDRDRLSEEQRRRIEMLQGLLAEEAAQKASLARALQYEQQKTEELINAVPWMVLWVSSDFKYKEVNSFFARFNGAPPKAFEDREVGTCGEDQELTDIMRRFVCDVSSKTAAAEVHLVRDGATQSFLLLMHRSKLRSDASIIGIDVTRQKRGETELRKQTQRAETAASELRRALANNEKMRRRAEAMSKAKGEFLAVMSHELRTPMGGVLGMLDLLGESDLTPQQQEYLEAAQSSGQALLGAINSILDFSRIDAGKIELEHLDFDVRTVLEEVGDTLALQVEKKGLELICLHEPDAPCKFRGDPGRLKQILLNLATNAVKFTARGEVRIEGSIHGVVDHEAKLRFEVSDTGSGIPEHLLDKLFDPFTQADSSTTRKFGGTGLGLAISRRLVELMGGSIGATSLQGQGSTFWFTVTLTRQPPEPAHATVLEPLAAEQRILVVEPNATNRRYIAGLLKSWGCRCDQIQDGVSALTLLQAAAERSNPFHAVIISRRLPEMDGKRLGAAIKTNPLFSQTLLLLMAWWGERLDNADLLTTGFSAMLTKPIKHRALYESLGIGERRAADKVGQTVLRPIAATREHEVKVLVVEDNLIGQKILAKMLEKLGCRCEFALNGREALESLSTTDYDLVLMDCHMPVMDGYETARRIRSPNGTVRNPRIPIIAVTANAMEGDREKCLSAGMDDYLPKPLAPRALACAIEHWLDQSRDIPAGRQHSAE